MSDPTNADRAERGRQVLEYYVTLTGTDWEDALVDLLSDLRLLCDVDDELIFGRAVDTSFMHYEAEVQEAEDEDKGTLVGCLELELCDDCTMAECNGDYSGMDDETSARVTRGFANLCSAPEFGHLAPNFDSNLGHGIYEFSRAECDVCGTTLAGGRHRFALFPKDWKPSL